MASTRNPALSAAVVQAIAQSVRKQTDIAIDVGVTQATVNRWANGNADPDPEHWERLEDALQLDRGELARAAFGVSPHERLDEIIRRVESLEEWKRKIETAPDELDVVIARAAKRRSPRRA